jgi:hypothetical protein
VSATRVRKCVVKIADRIGPSSACRSPSDCGRIDVDQVDFGVDLGEPRQIHVIALAGAQYAQAPAVRRCARDERGAQVLPMPREQGPVVAGLGHALNIVLNAQATT